MNRKYRIEERRWKHISVRMFATIYLATFLTVMVLQRRSFNPVSSVHPVKWNFARASKAYRTLQSDKLKHIGHCIPEGQKNGK